MSGARLGWHRETLLHLFMRNRGVLITPFHSMLLMCPATSGADVDRYVSEFGASLRTAAGTWRLREGLRAGPACRCG